MTFYIVDREHRRRVAEFETREEAEQRLAAMLEEDQSADGVLVIEHAGVERPEPQLLDEIERVRDTED